MKSTHKSVVVAVCLLLLGVSLTACTGDKQDKESVSDAVSVIVGRVQKVQERETVAVSGTVSTPNSPAEVGFLVSGKVVFVGPREGEFVKKGQVLASIDPTDYQLDQAAAKAQTDHARVGLERAEDEHRRMKMLYDTKSLAPNDFLKYKAAYDAAVQQHEQALASEKLSRKRLTDGTLYATTSGYIAKRSIEPGDTAAAGRPVFEIVQIEPVEVNVGVPETDVHRVRIGQEADITVPALPGKTFQGTVRLINVSADPNTRTYMARIAVENPERLLRVGMVAEAAIRGDRTISMVTLPGEAVVRDPQGATQVFIYYPDQKRVYAKRVDIGAVIDKDVEIKSGLAGDELIVLAGQGKLRNGLVVSATEQTRPN
ncbi:efflux RND transporter periplasmic adaptor subunit [Desulfuromonas sp. TF]|uniref:efflux RND transporter periplasmic adaptor subunit n=1 Tax=Desulfuromonas sp. TF TaxID=1232410 RepID=UPI000425D14E|nr:efflux RND transporter periplasmic adaptor subunit [Desulfuromonas sp. TF]